MYRVNLAQVVDKYIGETEKNLERIFDAADASDTILFFDEADALFGRRTEVRDAHDRYANLEVAYLLERMERFKGLGILATNRRGDLDEAFLRRLRYIVDFPMPDAAERRRIWASVIPAGVDPAGLDLDFLARQFQLTGGNIRSAVLNACLQTASSDRRRGVDGRPALQMDQVLVAVKREHDKFQRAVGPAQFGPYAGIVEAGGHA
jgi:SpoVK/Ycf46/Vps4 family AAA+-type ATPase